jgi:hypothetical protein
MKALLNQVGGSLRKVAIMLCAIMLVSCQHAGRPISYSTLTHASREVLVQGWSQADVSAVFGAPKERRTTEFRPLKYGVPKQLPAFDEQWIYYEDGGMRIKLVFFAKDAVVLVIDEWSDY